MSVETRTASEEAIHEELEALEGQSEEANSSPSPDAPSGGLPGGLKGTGPRLFCGHVPKETTEEMVFQHFSQWGTVTDVYFPRHKKTMKRRPFCFVTFAARDGAERALAQSPLQICGIPIKNLTIVEDRDKYYKEKHATARDALLKALHALGSSGANHVTSDQISNLAAIMALEGVSTEGVLQSLGLLGSSSAGSSLLPPPAAAPADDALRTAMQQAAASAPATSSPFGLPTATGGLDFEAALAAVAAASAGVSTLGLSPSSSLGMGYPDSLMQHLPPTSSAADSRSRSLPTSADWFSPASSARTSFDVSSLLPPGSQLAGRGIRMSEPLSAAASISPATSLNSLRLSLDAVLHMQQAQQQQALLAMACAGQQGMTPASLHAAMQNSLYTPTAAPVYAATSQAQHVHHSMNTVMQSGFFQSTAAPLPSLPPYSGGLSGYGTGGGQGLPPLSDAMWSQQQAVPARPPRPSMEHQASFGGPSMGGPLGAGALLGGAQSSDVLAVMAGWGPSQSPIGGPGFQWPTSTA